MKKILFLLGTFLLVSCFPEPEFPDDPYNFGGGVIIVNEGNFNSGNGSLSFYSYDSLQIYNDIFYTANGRPLGDVPNSVNYSNNRLYVVINNSGKIEELNPLTFKSISTVTGLKSPRNMLVNNGKGYVTSLWSDSLAVIDLSEMKVSDYIDLKKSSEAITGLGNRVFISSWMGGNKVMEINSVTDEVTDSVEVGTEPETMVIDKNFRLWVLCTGGWQKLHNPELDVININTMTIERRYVFPLESSPTCLRIDAYGEILYFLDGGVRRMEINSVTLPANPFIPQQTGIFYKMGVNTADGHIFVTDVADYVHKGYVYIFDHNGDFLEKHQTGIIPGEMTFRIQVKD